MESMQNTYNYTRRCEQTVTMHVECWQSQNSEDVTDVVPTCVDSNCVWCFFYRFARVNTMSRVLPGTC